MSLNHWVIGNMRLSHAVDHPLRSVSVFTVDFRLSRGAVPTLAQVGDKPRLSSHG